MTNENLIYETIDGIITITDTKTNESCTLDTLLDQFESMQRTMKQLKNFEISRHTSLSVFEAETQI